MGKIYYIDGDLVSTTGNLYTKDIYAGDLCCPEGAVSIKPKNGVLKITEETGSIFDTYHVKGCVCASGIENGNIYAFKDIYELTTAGYQHNRELLLRILASPPEEDQLKNLFYQQQYVSVFGLFERFLCDTFVRQTCDREESYNNVLKSMTFKKLIRKADKKTINGPDCLSKELLYVKIVENNIVYHRFNILKELFEAAFCISVDFGAIEKALKIRHDIVHRFGLSIKGTEIFLTKRDVEDLLDKVDKCVETISTQIQNLQDGIV